MLFIWVEVDCNFSIVVFFFLEGCVFFLDEDFWSLGDLEFWRLIVLWDFLNFLVFKLFEGGGVEFVFCFLCDGCDGLFEREFVLVLVLICKWVGVGVGLFL